MGVSLATPAAPPRSGATSGIRCNEWALRSSGDDAEQTTDFDVNGDPEGIPVEMDTVRLDTRCRPKAASAPSPTATSSPSPARAPNDTTPVTVAGPSGDTGYDYDDTPAPIRVTS
jgi:hypothetical protein